MAASTALPAQAVPTEPADPARENRVTGPRTPVAEHGVSVVIPAHDEASTIADVVAAVRASTPGLIEVLVIDDGSSDGTGDAAVAAGARVIRLSPNRGKGVAIRRGVDEAAGDVVVFIDGDGQDDPAEIPTLLDAMADDVAMVIGSRFLGTFHDGAITRLNHFGSRLLLGTLNTLFSVRITDPFAGFRAVRTTAFRECAVTAERYDIEVDVLLALLRSGRRVVEVPVERYAREHGRTKLSVTRDGARILWRIVAWRLGRGG